MFKPRASKMGHYMSCPAAMYYDLHNPVETERWRNKYTSFGTIVHWRIQEMLGCDLTHAEAPAEEDYIEAEEMLHKVDAAVVNAVEELRKEYGDALWFAEEELDNGSLTGHVDLTHGKVLVDIKTASRVPARRQISPAHYWQLLAYNWLTGAEELRILYVNSKAEWVVLSESVEIENERVQRDVARMKRLCSQPIDAAVYGSACTDCVHCARCRDSAVPRIGDPTEARKLEIVGGAMSMLGGEA